MNQLSRVVVTGIGAVTSIGVGAKQSWKALLNGQCGISSIDDQTYKCRVFGKLPSNFNAKEHETTFKDSILLSLANAICDEALKDAQLDTSTSMPIDRERFGITIASAGGICPHIYRSMLNHDKKEALLSFPFILPSVMALKHQLYGPLECPQQACAADAVIAGGVDINSYSHYHRGADVLDAQNQSSNDFPEQAMKPYDENRQGTVFADGGAVLIVESLQSALKRNARIHYEIVGFHQNTEAYHLTSSKGFGILACMIGALKEAGLQNYDIDAINAHGTSTIQGDEVEARMMKILLGTQNELLMKLPAQELSKQTNANLSLKNLKDVGITGCKGNIGHAGASAGAIELVFAAFQIAESILPNILGLVNPIEPLLNFAHGGHIYQDVDVMMKASLGFGSNHAAFVLKKYKL